MQASFEPQQSFESNGFANRRAGNSTHWDKGGACENKLESSNSNAYEIGGATGLERADSAVTAQRPEVTGCNLTAPIATLAAQRNPGELLLHPNCTQIFADWFCKRKGTGLRARVSCRDPLMDIHAYSTKDGAIVWDFDTVGSYKTVNGVEAKGGSPDGAGPAIGGGMLFVNSGYVTWGGMPGNVPLAFSDDGK